MQNEIALVQSRTFWSAVLALVAQVAAQFHWNSVLGVATNPGTVTNIMTGVSLLGIVLAGVFRVAAKTQVTSVTPPLPPNILKSLLWLGVFAGALGSLFAISACSPVGQAALGVANQLQKPIVTAACADLYKTAPAQTLCRTAAGDLITLGEAIADKAK
jgi:hypothetical protein